MTVYFDQIEEEVASNSIPVGRVDIPKQGGLYRNIIKPIIEAAAVLLVAPFVVPVVLLLAVIVGNDGHNPFYWSKRVGKGGKVFHMLKLRTMVPNADAMLDQHLAEDPKAKAEWDETQKLKNDPRITKFGRALRKTSLDELPQLWNVLVGEMSLVGPRPMLPSQRAMYPGVAYYALKPGITGMWQISDRNEVEFAKRAVFDKDYYVKMSFPLDFGILTKTVGVVIKGTGY
ncbi:MAG: sugar transferase [Paracoccaceae bacterium]